MAGLVRLWSTRRVKGSSSREANGLATHRLDRALDLWRWWSCRADAGLQQQSGQFSHRHIKNGHPKHPLQAYRPCKQFHKRFLPVVRNPKTLVLCDTEGGRGLFAMEHGLPHQGTACAQRRRASVLGVGHQPLPRRSCKQREAPTSLHS